jgi:hypothetical protein
MDAVLMPPPASIAGVAGAHSLEKKSKGKGKSGAEGAALSPKSATPPSERKPMPVRAASSGDVGGSFASSGSPPVPRGGPSGSQPELQPMENMAMVEPGIYRVRNEPPILACVHVVSWFNERNAQGRCPPPSPLLPCTAVHCVNWHIVLCPNAHPQVIFFLLPPIRVDSSSLSLTLALRLVPRPL